MLEGGIMASARSGLQTSRKITNPIMKTITTLTATLGAALLLAGAPALASADTQSGPIRIDSVHLVAQALTEREVAPDAALISFTNEGASAATDVVFALESESGFVLDTYNDVGSFAPGVSVRHSFSDHNDASRGQQVVVAKATFADGTVWTNPDVALVPASSPAEGVQVVSYSLDY
jgi:hypothetical protein